MVERKQTPDVLGEILGSAPSLPEATPLARPASSAVSARRAWEYRVVSFQDYHGWRPRFINGEEVVDWSQGPLLHDYANLADAEGWELVAASAGMRLYGNADQHHLYFRRLAAAAPPPERQ